MSKARDERIGVLRECIGILKWIEAYGCGSAIVDDKVAEVRRKLEAVLQKQLV